MATISIPYLHIDIDVQPDEQGKIAIDFRTFPRGVTQAEVIDTLKMLLAHLEPPPAPAEEKTAVVPTAAALSDPPSLFIGRGEPPPAKPAPEPQA